MPFYIFKFISKGFSYGLNADLSSLTHFAWDSRILTSNCLSRQQEREGTYVSRILVHQDVCKMDHILTTSRLSEKYNLSNCITIFRAIHFWSQFGPSPTLLWWVGRSAHSHPHCGATLVRGRTTMQRRFIWGPSQTRYPTTSRIHSRILKNTKVTFKDFWSWYLGNK